MSFKQSVILLSLSFCTGNDDRTRKKRGRPRSKSAPAVLVTAITSKKRKEWSNESMLLAMQAVKNGSTSITRAAKLHGVPRQTLQDRVSGRVQHGVRPGPKPYLSSTEENDLAGFLVDASKVGYGKSRQQVKAIAACGIRDKGLLDQDKVLSNGWYYSFMRRQDKLALRKGDPTANVRMDCLNDENIKEYFDMLKDTLLENHLMEKPAQIYNVDESGMPLDHRPPKVISEKGQKKVRSRTSGNKSQITVIACVSASGHALPPFVIFDTKGLNPEWTKGEVVGTTYGLSAKGWVDTELFKGWLVNHFLKYAVGARPLLLILDGHSSHYQPELIKYAKENEVILVCLPPHTTHETQPLDTSVFRSLKQNWSQVCHKFFQTNPGRVITKYDFSTLLNQSWGQTMIPNVITSGFRRSGIYPFNPNAISCGIITTTQNTSHSAVSDSRDTNDDNILNLSDDQVKLYERRFTEGYDLPDPVYLKWLRINHPTVENQITSFDESPILQEQPSQQHCDENQVGDSRPGECTDNMSLLELLSANETCENLCLERSIVEPVTASNGEDMGSTTTEGRSVNLPSSAATNRPVVEPPDHGSTTTEDRPTHLPSSAATIKPAVEPPDHEGQLNYISKYLVQYVPVKKAPNSAAKRATGARVLTSEECSKYIFEQEEKKRKEKEEKEVRKAERERKKKEKEEAAKKKAEEVAKKKEETVRRKEEAAKRKEEAAKKRAEKSHSKRKASVARMSAAKRSNDVDPDDGILQSEDENTELDVEGVRGSKIASADFNENQCSICFRTYEEDVLEETELCWLKCVCKRWVHEDCVTEVVMDKNGRELLCPYCVP